MVTLAAAAATSPPNARETATTSNDHGRACACGVRGGCRWIWTSCS